MATATVVIEKTQFAHGRRTEADQGPEHGLVFNPKMECPMFLPRPSSLFCSAVLCVAAQLPMHASASVVHVLDRSSVHSSTHMCAPLSSGQSLADATPASGGTCPGESAAGDIDITFRWSNGRTASGVWSPSSGKPVTSNAVLSPNAPLPGYHWYFQDAAGDEYGAFIEQSGDTFFDPWEIRNGGQSTYSLTSVVLAARGSPDMGFDTDDGANPGHGAGGFLLSLVAGLNEYAGDLTVTYDWFNDWNGTTDMFHRMTIDFEGTGLARATSLVFLQDTDEKVPEPATLALVTLALAGLAARRRVPRADGRAAAGTA